MGSAYRRSRIRVKLIIRTSSQPPSVVSWPRLDAVEGVLSVVADLLVVGGGPVAAGIAGELLAVGGFDEVDAEGARHRRRVMPRPVAAGRRV